MHFYIDMHVQIDMHPLFSLLSMQRFLVQKSALQSQAQHWKDVRPRSVLLRNMVPTRPNYGLVGMMNRRGQLLSSSEL